MLICFLIRFGFESSKYILKGLGVRSYTSIVDQIKSMGFNTIRVPFSSQMLNRTTSPVAVSTDVDYTLKNDTTLPIAGDVDYSLNSDLVGLTTACFLFSRVVIPSF